MSKNRVKPGGVSQYIAKSPKDVQSKLHEIRKTIREVAPDAIETMSYFDMPGYSYKGYDYNGMFAWFSFKAPNVRLHIRPEAIVRNKKLLEKYKKTKAIVSFSTLQPIPKSLVKKLVRASLKSMKSIATRVS